MGFYDLPRDQWPTRQELEWDAEQERLDKIVCDTCGERLRSTATAPLMKRRKSDGREEDLRDIPVALGR